MKCVACGTEHDIQVVLINEDNIIKGVNVTYPAKYFYCSKSDTYYADEKLISENFASQQEAYQEKIELLKM